MKYIYNIYFIILTSIFVISMGFFTNSLLNPKEIVVTEDKPDEVEEPLPTSNAEQILNNLSLEEKIGQMLIIDYRKTTTMNSELENLLTTVKPGGFILFSENLKDYNVATNFISAINNTASIPLFMSVDFEGGRVDRFKDIKNYTYTKIAPMLEIGNTKDENVAYNTGVNMANILKDFNINLNFAPDADVFSNPENTVIGNRSFGSNPYLVSRMSIALAKGLSDNNIIPVYKHFPGHGNTSVDSHSDLPILNLTKEELLNNDLIPFKNAINNNAEVIMVGHLSLPKITNDNTPASLSHILITDILKNELGYQNIVITDALNMKALTKYYSDDEILELAINAGADMLLMPNNPLKAITLIKEDVTNGEISEEQINKSVLKILNLKEKYNLITS